jgi:hypothetical protein
MQNVDEAKYESLYNAVKIVNKKKNPKQQLSNLREIIIYFNFNNALAVDESLFNSIIEQLDFLSDNEVDRKIHRLYIYLLLEIVATAKNFGNEKLQLLVPKFLEVLNSEILNKTGSRQQLSWRSLGELCSYSNSDKFRDETFQRLFKALNLLRFPNKSKNKSAIFISADKEYATSIKLWCAILSSMRRIGSTKATKIIIENNNSNNVFLAIGSDNVYIARHAFSIVLNTVESIEQGSPLLLELLIALNTRWRNGKHFFNVEDFLCVSYISRIISKIASKIDFDNTEQCNNTMELYELVLVVLQQTGRLLQLLIYIEIIKYYYYLFFNYQKV